MTKITAICGGTLIHPSGAQSRGDILIADDRIAAIGTISIPTDADLIDATGALVAPGMVDLGVFAVDKPAFIAGGITRIALMPDASPPLDNPGLVQRSALAAKPDLWVHPLGAATRGLAGLELTEYALMAKAGAKAIATVDCRFRRDAPRARLCSLAWAYRHCPCRR
jgi:dihydroorotase